MANVVISVALGVGLQLLSRAFADEPTKQVSEPEKIGFTGSTSGAPLPFCLGPKNRPRTPPVYISKFVPILVRGESPGGGKGGGSPQPSTPSHYIYTVTVAIYLGEAIPGGAVPQIWAGTKLIFDRGIVDSRIGYLAIYDGLNRIYPSSAIQGQDPEIVAAKARDGVTTPTLSYRGKAYAVITYKDLTDWGNSLPEHSAYVSAQLELPVQDAIKKLWERGGLDIADIDTSRVPGCLLGKLSEGPSSPALAIQNIMSSHNLAKQDIGTKMVFFSRSDPDVILVGPNDFVASEEERGFKRKPGDTDALPTDLTINFVDPENALNRGSVQSQKLIETGEQPLNQQVLDFAETLYPKDAYALAQRLLWQADVENDQIFARLPPKFLGTLEGDVLRFQNGNELLDVRVTSVTVDQNWIVRIEGKAQQDQVFSTSGAFTSSPTVITGPYTPPVLRLVMLNLPPLAEGDDAEGKVYFVGARVNARDQFAGAVLYRATSPGGAYVSRKPISAEASIGYTTSLMPDWSGVYRWEYGTTLKVRLRQPPSACTEEEAYSGRNAVALVRPNLVSGKADIEIAQFLQVTPTGSADAEGYTEYELKGWLRARRNTENGARGHLLGETVIMLSQDARVEFDGLVPGDRGRTYQYKLVPTGGLVGDAVAVSHVVSVETLLPFSPTHIFQTVGGTGTRTITWVPRSRRLYADWLSSVVTLETATERYKAEIYNLNTQLWETITDNIPTRSLNIGASTRSAAGWGTDQLALVRISQYSTTLGVFGRTQEAMV